MIYTNQMMREAFAIQSTRDYPLSKKLEELLSKGLLEEEGGLFLKSFQTSLKSITKECATDLTGRECTINKFHIEDYVEENIYQQSFLALKTIFNLVKNYDCRIILSDDEGDTTIQFHQVRKNEVWIDENLESYKLNGLLYLDTQENHSFPERFADFLDQIPGTNTKLYNNA